MTCVCQGIRSVVLLKHVLTLGGIEAGYGSRKENKRRANYIQIAHEWTNEPSERIIMVIIEQGESHVDVGVYIGASVNSQRKWKCRANLIVDWIIQKTKMSKMKRAENRNERCRWCFPFLFLFVCLERLGSVVSADFQLSPFLSPSAAE